MIICFSEQEERYLVEALQDSQRLWREHVEKDALTSWLRRAYSSGCLQRQQLLLLVVPETKLARRLLPLPVDATARQLRGMAATALLPVLKERPAALALTPVAQGVAVVGCKKSTFSECTAPFGPYRHRLRLVGAADAAAAQSQLADGCYCLQEALWTAVLVVQNGRIIDGRVDNGGNSFALAQELRAVHHEGLPDQVQPLQLTPEAVPEEAALVAAALSIRTTAALPAYNGDRLLLLLLLSCVVLPGLLFLGSQLRPLERVEESDPAPLAAVSRSDYHTLLTQAYAVKSERITLLNHEASDNSLALSGRCSEALDLADYMRQLAAVEPTLHPLLLEMTRKSNDNSVYYEFIVQISLEGGAPQ